MAAQLQRKHPEFSESVIADVTKQLHGDTRAADQRLAEMSSSPRPQQQQQQQQKTSSKHAPTLEELNAIRAKYEEASRMLEKLVIEIQPIASGAEAEAEAEAATAEPTTTKVPAVTAKVAEAAAATVEFEYSVPSPSASDWIALFIHDRQLSCTSYQWTRGAPAGKGVFPNLPHGTYDVRLLRGRDSEHFIARSSPVLVGPPVALSVAAGADGDHVVVSYSDAGRGDWVGLYAHGSRSNKKYLAYQSCAAHPRGSVQFPAPRAPGEYDVRFFKASSGYAYSGSATFTVPNTDSLQAKQTGPFVFDVAWQCRSRQRTSGDWIGVFAPEATSRQQYLASQYLSHGRIEPSGNAGVVHFDLSKLLKQQQQQQHGTFEFRFFSPKAEELPLRATITIF